MGASELPVLLIWGKGDQVVPFAMSEKLTGVLPNAEFHALEDTGHLPPVERPEECARFMRAFLQGAHNPMTLSSDSSPGASVVHP